VAPTPDEYTWRYLPGGAVRHLLGQDRIAAVCGRSPVWYAPDGWYGTGTQAEYETCAGLAACRRCVAIVPAADGWEVAA
jgi:hypothetical protein